MDWDGRYVHALERALRGRKLDELLTLLDDRHYLHPVLLPALADVIRSQGDGARGSPRKLTHVQDAVIRTFIDRVPDKIPDRIKRLAKIYNVSADLIKESLKRTAKPKKK